MATATHPVTPPPPFQPAPPPIASPEQEVALVRAGETGLRDCRLTPNLSWRGSAELSWRTCVQLPRAQPADARLASWSLPAGATARTRCSPPAMCNWHGPNSKWWSTAWPRASPASPDHAVEHTYEDRNPAVPGGPAGWLLRAGGTAAARKPRLSALERISSPAPDALAGRSWEGRRLSSRVRPKVSSAFIRSCALRVGAGNKYRGRISR